MNNKFIIGGVVVLLGLIGGWYVWRSNSGLATRGLQNPGAATATSAANNSGGSQAVAIASVSFTKNGFNPTSITVKVGTTVRFTNDSDSSMWVASDPHPTHTLLPGFDELAGVARGSYYDYTFVKVGTWTYHNHLNPGERGTVVVTP